jgi:glycosyltransferase involved in cell wall biosynthesis
LGALPEDSVRKNEIFEKMRSLGGFGKYLGVMQDVRPAIAGSHCVVLPSYREGTPRSILEASAMGRPVIVTDVPGCRNAVKKNASGFLCRPQSAADLGSKMKDMLDLTEQKREEMGRAGSEFVREHFDEKIVIDAYLTAIRACAVGGV